MFVTSTFELVCILDIRMFKMLIFALTFALHFFKFQANRLIVERKRVALWKDDKK